MGNAILMLADYARKRNLIEACDLTWAVNGILEGMQLDSVMEIPVSDDADLSQIML